MSPWLQLLRPKQWIKNGFVFAPLFFAGKFYDAGAWVATIEAALCFLAVSCVVYIANDIHDAQEDHRHPVKKNRPVASGAMTAFQAAILACICGAVAVFIMTTLPLACAGIALGYIALNVFYTLWLKTKALLDIFFIAFCYVLRVLMGCYALSVMVSPWIILTTFLLALFLGFSKRYHEMGFQEYVESKANLQHYSREFLDKLIIITSGAALLAYAIYAVEIEIKTGKSGMIYTAGFVAFGLFRYLQSIYVYKQGGEPETIILRDKWQLINLALWLLVTMWVLF